MNAARSFMGDDVDAGFAAADKLAVRCGASGSGGQREESTGWQPRMPTYIDPKNQNARMLDMLDLRGTLYVWM